MTQRIWAPQRATIEPDQVVLAMLQPTGDAAGDLGGALLAMHRAGAAACEAVAKGAVPSEHGLVSALARSREVFAPRAVDVVSKSMEGNYAGLLVRDVLDDAEQAALTLYRSCVSKGVAPPIAASRVGAVYGVPAKELGKYAALATDPRVNPVALTDEADRTLLGYFSKVVDEEAGEVKETVSKSPTGHARELGDSEEGWSEREHPRDRATGRFVHGAPRGGPPVREGQIEPITIPGIEIPSVTEEPGLLARLRSRVGMGGQAAPTVGTTPAQAREKQATKRAQRTQRQMRQLAQNRGALKPTGQTRATATATARATATATATATARAQAKFEAAMAAPATARPAANVGSKVPMESTTVVPAPRRQTRDFTGTALERVADEGDYGRLHTPHGEALAFTLMQSESFALRRSMPTVAGETLAGQEPPRLVRAHALIGAVPQQGPDLLDLEDPDASRAAKDTRRAAAQEAKADLDPSGYAGAPLVSTVSPDDVFQGGDLDQELLSRRSRLAMSAGTDVDGQYRAGLENEAFQNSVALRDYHDPTTWHAVVPQPDQFGVYQLPIIEEYVVADEVRGYMEGGYRNQHAVLDPNQAFIVSSRPEQFYDAENQVMVNRYTLRPLEEDEVDLYTDPATAKLFGRGRFGKALEGHDAVRFEQQHPRDEEGRFATTSTRTSGVAPLQVPGIEVTPVHEQVQAPARRPQAATRRTLRGQRQLAKPARATAIAPQARASATATAKPKEAKAEARAVTRVQAALTEALLRDKRKDLPVLDDRTNYLLLTGAEFDDIRKRIVGGRDGMLPVHGAAREILASKESLDGSTVIGAMNLNLEDEITNNEGEATKGYVWQRKPVAQGLLRNAEDEAAMAHHIRRIFDTHPDIAQLHIDYAQKPGHYVLYANRQPVEEQVLIEMDDDLDMTEPMQLVEIGRYRSMDMGHRREDLGGAIVAITGDTPNAPINARMHQFRLQNVSLRRYRMENKW